VTLFLFLIIAFGILALVYGYTGWRLITRANLSSSGKIFSWSVLIFLLVVAPLQLVLRATGVETSWLDLLAWFGYIGLGFFSLVFSLLVVRDLILLVRTGVKKSIALVRDHIKPKFATTGPADRERRLFLVQSTNLGIVGISGIMAGYGLYEARRRADIEEIVVPILDLPRDLQGFRIAQFTDIHVGPTVKRNYVQGIVEQVNGLEADVIAFTGDLVDGSVPGLRDDVAPLENLSARHGTFFITGNHEYYSGALPWIEEARRIGFTVLLNEHRVLQHGAGRIILAGVTDYSAGQFISSQASDPLAALSNSPPADIKILLAHQPRSIFEASKAGFDLQISGHTHGGQFIPWNFLVTLGQPYIKGLHKFNNTWIYVSRGTGYWGPPLRLGVPPEITVIKLIAA
jgi:predicted MPP superfamily phosphohydrolase